ncbi:alpha/beta hydrolase [Kutzneria viridogrisea]|uniref:Peptidase S33 tripeptidyl aminopeptidase-like C-terminal domain-containing protein n=2 Tax=Kutzneria TaxID=43356 RepID=W5WH18_9PSEU|nr:alpha/beta hydrolase [Kutzneria albida]AHI00123.1 hypothetical protein KALB_6764 [Kutzneria albida DSM 43870]MBA8925302.1 pimeloyl-ACP methyl ester carboxylesterase [Kutzneria viridogrisea]
MPRQAFRGRAIGLLLPVLLTAAACAVGPSVRPVIAVNDGSPQAKPGEQATGSLPPLDKPSGSTVSWSECGGGARARLGELAANTALAVRCGRIINELDAPNSPGVGDVALSVLRAGTGDIPLVVLNDVAGEPGTVYAAKLASKLPPELLKTFFLVGMDRRGTGTSDPAQCVPDQVRARIVGFDPASSQLDGLLDAAHKASQECVLDMDDRLAALDSWRTAADVDELRKQLGVPKLNAIGHGDGSRVLTVYADRYADRVGRLVLDGSPDPTLDPAGAAQAGAVGAEAAYTAFAADCKARACPLGGDPRQALTGLLEQVRAKPLVNPNGAQLTAGGVLQGVLTGLADRSGWPALAEAISKAAGGDGTALGRYTAPLLGVVNGNPARLDAQLTQCNDTQTRLPPEQISGMVKDWSGKMPLFGGLFAQRLLLCSSWPVPAKPLAAPSGHGAPPILVLSTASDPVTPEEGTARTARQLASGVLVSWQGGGHGALAQSPCATAAAQQFLTNALVPADGTACPP